jgi:hypothetical protein
VIYIYIVTFMHYIIPHRVCVFQVKLIPSVMMFSGDILDPGGTEQLSLN